MFRSNNLMKITFKRNHKNQIYQISNSSNINEKTTSLPSELTMGNILLMTGPDRSNTYNEYETHYSDSFSHGPTTTTFENTSNSFHSAPTLSEQMMYLENQNINLSFCRM